MTLAALVALAAAAALPPALGLGVAPAPVPAPPFSGCVTTEAELKEAAARGGRYCVDGLVAMSSEQTDVDKDLELYSESGVDGVDGFIGTAPAVANRFLIASGDVSMRLEGLILSNFSGAAIAMDNVTMTLIDCIFSQNSVPEFSNDLEPPQTTAVVAGWPGFFGDLCSNTSVLVQGCTFLNNTAGYAWNGAAIQAYCGSNVTVRGARAHEREKERQRDREKELTGSVHAHAHVRSHVYSCACAHTRIRVLTRASARVCVPAHTHARVADSLFEAQVTSTPRSFPGYGGAIYISGKSSDGPSKGSTFHIENSTFRECSADFWAFGGAIAVEGLLLPPIGTVNTNVTIVDTLFEDNLASAIGSGNSGYGGAIYAFGGTANVSVSRSAFIGNNAGLPENGGFLNGLGGAIMIDTGPTLRVSNCSFVNNTAVSGLEGAGGAIQSDSGFFAGGGANVMIVEDSVFIDNIAPYASGGALYAAGGTFDSTDPDSPISNPANISISNCSFVNNTAPQVESGGAAIGAQRAVFINITNSSFSGNAAGGTIGAIVLDSISTDPANPLQARVEGCSFEDNTAASGDQTATALWVGNPSSPFVEVCGSANAFANAPVPQTTFPSPLPPCE